MNNDKELCNLRYLVIFSLFGKIKLYIFALFFLRVQSLNRAPEISAHFLKFLLHDKVLFSWPKTPLSFFFNFQQGLSPFFSEFFQKFKFLSKTFWEVWLMSCRKKILKFFPPQEVNQDAQRHRFWGKIH